MIKKYNLKRGVLEMVDLKEIKELAKEVIEEVWKDKIKTRDKHLNMLEDVNFDKYKKMAERINNLFPGDDKEIKIVIILDLMDEEVIIRRTSSYMIRKIEEEYKNNNYGG